MSVLAFNIANPRLYIQRLLTSQEQQFVTDLVGLTYATGDILYYNGSELTNLAIGSTGESLIVTAGIPNWAYLAVSDLSDVTKSATEPVAPAVGDLWIDIS